MLGALLQNFAIAYTRSTPQVTTTNDVSTTAVGLLVFFLLFVAACIVFGIAVHWKIFTKAGKPGWASIIPIYSTIVLFRIIGRPLWWFLWLFVPLANIVVAIIIVNDLAKSFGKDTGWTLGLIFLPIIFYPMLAFGKAKYKGPAAGK